MKHLRRGLFLSTFLLTASIAQYSLAESPPPAPASPSVQYGTTQAPITPPHADAPNDPLAALGPPVILWLRGQGASVEDLGSAHGLEGWLVMAKDIHGQNVFQTFYTTPDGEAVVAGVMMDDHGKDLTGMQYALSAQGQQIIADNAAPSTTAPPQAPPPGSASESPQQISIQPEAAAAQAVAQVDSPVDETALGISPTAFNKVLDTAYLFHVGGANVPNLVLVADPHCPFCHKAWQYLAPLVKSRQISVDILLIHGLPETESPKKDAVAILSNPDASTAWLNGVGSEEGVPIPAPKDQAALTRGASLLKKNDNFARDMQVSATPTVFWFKDGQTFRGQTLGSIIAFLKAVQAGGVSS